MGKYYDTINSLTEGWRLKKWSRQSILGLLTVWFASNGQIKFKDYSYLKIGQFVLDRVNVHAEGWVYLKDICSTKVMQMMRTDPAELYKAIQDDMDWNPSEKGERFEFYG